MCYDVRYLTLRQKKYAEKLGKDASEIQRLENQFKVIAEETGPVYHTTAFDHWKLPVITNNQPEKVQLFQWGLIPNFVKDLDQYHEKYASRYLNSRIESLFDEKIFNPKLKRSLDNPFYKSAVDRRCVVVLDGYYDWHWQGKNSYNFHVLLRDESPMLIAGIWRTWRDSNKENQLDTVSLITTDANGLCREVHNRPKASEGPRQLAIIEPDVAAEWLSIDAGIEELKKIIRVYPEDKMKAYPVKKLFHQEGRKRIPLNDEECTEEKQFSELEFGANKSKQGSLF